MPGIRLAEMKIGWQQDIQWTYAYFVGTRLGEAAQVNGQEWNFQKI